MVKKVKAPIRMPKTAAMILRIDTTNKNFCEPLRCMIVLPSFYVHPTRSATPSEKARRRNATTYVLQPTLHFAGHCDSPPSHRIVLALPRVIRADGKFYLRDFSQHASNGTQIATALLKAALCDRTETTPDWSLKISLCLWSSQMITGCGIAAIKAGSS